MKLRELQPLVDMMVASGWGDSEVVARLGDEYYTVPDFYPSNLEGTADHCEIVLGRIGRCICARCAKYDGCPNAAPAPNEDVLGYEGICKDCREDRRHLGHTPEPATKPNCPLCGEGHPLSDPTCSNCGNSYCTR